MTDTLTKLAKLYQSDPEGFESVIADFQANGPEIFRIKHPRHRTDTRKKPAYVLGWIWAKVEFLKWRDGVSILQACKRLEYFHAERGDVFHIYQTDDYKWHVSKGEPKPEVFEYATKGWQGLKAAHNKFYDLTEEEQRDGEFKLNLMKNAHEGKWSPINLEKMVPPKL